MTRAKQLWICSNKYLCVVRHSGWVELQVFEASYVCTVGLDRFQGSIGICCPSDWLILLSFQTLVEYSAFSRAFSKTIDVQRGEIKLDQGVFQYVQPSACMCNLVRGI